VPKSVVFAVWGSLGDLHPYLAIALGLRERGHRCVVATNNFFRARVEEAGLEFAPMGPHLGPDSELMEKIKNPWRGAMSLMRDLVLPYTGAAFRETMAAVEGADLLVTHPICYAAHVAAEKAGIRWASTVLAPMGLFSVREPSLSARLPVFSRSKTFGALVDRLALNLGHSITSKWTVPVGTLRAELGLPAGAHPIFEGQFSPSLTLALFSSLFGNPQPDWPPNTVVTGFPFYRETATLDAELCRFLDGGEPPVVFTLGSSMSAAPGTFFDESLQAIRRLACRAILVVGEFIPQAKPSGMPANVAVLSYVPYATLFPLAAVNVHQGGIGTTAEALRSGRPMLVVPFAFDQPDNAGRAEKLGVGYSLPIKRYTAQRAAERLEPLLHEDSHARNAAAVGDRVRAEDGVSTACRELEALLAS
jgi:UDP:flavonoid glycosyltransferase YjiC (YdhE family)